MSDWEPVLTGDFAARALRVVAAIGADESAPVTLWLLDRPDQDLVAANAASLAGGRAGQAVFHAYFAAWHGEDPHRALDLLDGAEGAIEDVLMSPSLYAGFTGVAWAHTHLHHHLLGREDVDANQAIDDALSEYLSQAPWVDDYDLIGGLVGLGVYALDERPRRRADALLATVVRHLEALSVPDGEGVTWHTPPSLLVPGELARHPQGYFNLGVAHGVPGVVGLLGRACAAGHRAIAEPLLDAAVRWLLYQQFGPEAHGAYPTVAGPGLARHPARLAWCYGDAGVAATLLVAARGAQRADWERAALEIARRAADRSWESSGVEDAGLCHGAAGVGHIFNRLYQATHEPWLADAARAWFARTLDLRRPGQGIAGFLARATDRDGHPQWRPDPSWLTGTAGIGLALLAACTPIEPAWDRVMLVGTKSEGGT